MKLCLKHIIFLACCCCTQWLHSQTPQIIRYTTKEGLPSNSIYRTVIDKKGFLWIAGETGVTRYDGRTFKNYTTIHGLPDNEVTELMIDSSGRLWVLPFRKKPAYYNEKKDRFENSDTDPELNKLEMGNTSAANVLLHGGIAFCNNNRSLFIYKNNKTISYNKIYGETIRPRPDRVIDYQPEKYLIICSDSLRHIENGKITRAVYFGYYYNWSEYFNNTLYILQPDGITKFTFNTNGEISATNKQQYPFLLKVLCRAGKDLAVTSVSGNTYIIDAATLELKDNIFNETIVRNVLEDHNGNYWLSTKDEGLIKIQQKRISSYTDNADMVKSFNALLKTDKIIAGNNKGELFIYDGLYDTKKIILNTEENKSDTWVRNILELKNDIYVATQTGSFLIDKKSFVVKKSFQEIANKSTKAAYKLNDSTLLLGGHAQLFVYNSNTGRFADSVLKRVTAIGADEKQNIYIGSIDGLYRRDKDSLFYFGRQYKSLTYRVVSIVNTKDNLMWIGRSSDSLLVLKDDKLVASIPLGTIIPGTVCKVIYSKQPGEVWIGTDKGLNKLNYRFSNEKLVYNNMYFSMADGLIGEQVNDIVIKNDTVYVATNGGISYLPVNLQLPLADIATFITRVAVNNVDTAILSSYTLPYSKNNIRIEFSSVDLTGFNPLFEYSINNQEWIRAENNLLSLQNQPPDNYAIRIRSIKRDGTPSTQMATINFRIKTPFWKSTWFWAGLVIAGFALTLFLLQKRNRQRQKKAIEKIITEKKLAELEMQALKAQINPHFVFNCLNSIKGFIYEKNFLQADKYLDKFSELLRSTMDNADASVISLEEEIRYLDTYLQLEKLRFGDKFEYSIHTEPGVDKSNTFVPAMLLQPYVENAIRHGVRVLENKKGIITIAAKKEQDILVCEIDDNGIGREKAQQLKSKNHIEYQSRGMQLSKRRAELYNIQHEVVDKKDEKGTATGTTIILKIPAELKL
jgi:ligand-binding sensor domain-containing protein/anti-sigma regulatory factor (Ser/Thr protein kinase)